MSEGAGPVSGTQGPDVLTALRSGRIQGADARLRAATQLLEGTFYQELFKAMRQTVPEGGAISGGAGKEIFEGLLDQHMADAAAMKSERGLGSALYQFFVRGMSGPAEAAPGPAESPTPAKGE